MGKNKIKKKKIKISKSEKRKIADKIIKKHILWAVGAGSVPLPFVDAIGVAAIQLDMLRNLCKLYEIDFDSNQGKNIVTSLAGGSLSRFGAGLIKTIPVVGTILGALTMTALSGATTYAIGQVFISNFEDGVGLYEINLDAGEKLFQDAYEKGKEYVESINDEK